MHQQQRHTAAVIAVIEDDRIVGQARFGQFAKIGAGAGDEVDLQQQPVDG